MAHGSIPEAIDAGPVRLARRRLSDVPEILAAIQSSIAELAAFLRWAADGVPGHETLEAGVLAREADFEAGTGFEFVLREAATGEVVGEAGGDLRGDAAVELGYWVRTDRTGRGYASAAASALTTAVFGGLPQIERVELRMDKGNTRSAAIPPRLGFALVGEEHFDTEPLAGQTGQGEVWAVTRPVWALR